MGGDHDGDGNGRASDRTTIAIADHRAVGKTTPVAHEISQAAPSGGGSSPVLPVLIAVAVLAALSIGTVIYRQRHQTPVG